MELDEALALIKTQGEQITALTTEKDGLTAKLSEVQTTHEKELQAQFNKGYDKAKNKFEDEVGNGYIKKEDVEAMLSERERAFTVESELLKMGVKNPKRAIKSIDEDDLKMIGSDDFKAEDFVKKYADDIVFTKQGGTEQGSIEQPPKEAPSNFTKNNKEQKQPVTADSYVKLSDAEKASFSTAEKLAFMNS